MAGAAPSRTTSATASKIVLTHCPGATESQKVAEVSPVCSQIVKTSSVQRLLLVTSNSAHESDFLVALRKANSQRPDLHFELTYLDLSPTLDFFAMFFSLGRLRSGYFTGVYVTPQASTWSRVRHSSSPGQQPLRSRQHPLGFPELHPEAREKTLHSNAESEVSGSVLIKICESVVCLSRRPRN